VKKEPLRKCLATNERLAKRDLIRVVKNNEGKIFVDLTGKANGRGAYIKKSIEAIEIAKKKKCFERAFECQVDESIFEELTKIVNE
jgi:predicted RNA-binding protein YlxR (DUF448 family)